MYARIVPALGLLPLALLALVTGGCETEDPLGGHPEGDPPPSDPRLGPPEDWPGGRYAVEFRNALGEPITATLELPPGVDRVPAVMVLHGSGGLFRPPEEQDIDRDDFDPASGQYERQFREWSELLDGAGYAAFFPASFYSRGSFDWNDDPMPGWDDADRLRHRVYDAVAALDYLCRHPRIDCGRTAVIGFSNGGSTLLLSQYTGLDRHPDFPDMPLPPPGRLPRLAVAYYPGCGLHGFVGLAEGDYRPKVPLLVLHGSEDRLLDNCRTRARQSQALGGTLEHQIYAGADHGFDGYPETRADSDAEAGARTLVLARLRAAFAFARP